MPYLKEGEMRKTPITSSYQQTPTPSNLKVISGAEVKEWFKTNWKYIAIVAGILAVIGLFVFLYKKGLLTRQDVAAFSYY